MDFNEKQLAVNAFFSSQFNYCPLMWIYHNRTYNNIINRMYERCLSIINIDKRPFFEDLHHKNLRAPATERCLKYLQTSPEITQESFLIKDK